MWNGDYGWHWGWMSGWGILLWLLLIAVIFVLARGIFTGRGDGESRAGRALEILQERYARGEIDEEEFQRKRRELE